MRLIDADAYRAEMKIRQDACAEWRDEAKACCDTELFVRSDGALATFIEAKLTLDKMPTIDAVPVVRCRECAAYRSMEKSGGLCKNTGFWVPENGFCHDGERKDGADNG